MHKGYAFVQFSNPVEAKNAADGEDGRLVLNQNIGKIQLLFCSLAHPSFTFEPRLLSDPEGKQSEFRIKRQEIT